jgi:hypothetical protein
MVRMAHYWDTQMTQCEGGECSGLTYSDVFNIYTNPGADRCPADSTAFALYQVHAEGCSDDMTLDPGSPCIIPDSANFDNNRCCNLLKKHKTWDEFVRSRQTAVDTSSIFALGTACNNYLPPECNLESISQPNFDTLKECAPAQDSTGSGTPVIPPSGTSLTAIQCASLLESIWEDCCPEGCLTGIPDTCTESCAPIINEFFDGRCPSLVGLPATELEQFNTLYEKCQRTVSVTSPPTPSPPSPPSPVAPTGSLGGLCDCQGEIGMVGANQACKSATRTSFGPWRQRTFCTDKNTPEECAAVNNPYPNLCEWTPSPNIVS